MVGGRPLNSALDSMAISRTYRAETWAYVVWLGIFGIPLAILLVNFFKFGWEGASARGLLTPVILCAALMLLAAIWLSIYRLRFAESALEYRSWYGAWSVPYSQIRVVEASNSTPIEGLPIGVRVCLSDGSTRTVYAKVFSRAAIRELFSLMESDKSSSDDAV